MIKRFLENLPQRIFCGMDKRVEKFLHKEKALRYPYIQVNHPLLIRYLVFDVDRPRMFIWDEKGIPPPNIVSINKENGHFHLFYEIMPVYLKKEGGEKAISLLNDVGDVYRFLLEADKFITSQKQLVKNPLHPRWEVAWFANLPYTLSTLIEEVERVEKPLLNVKKALPEKSRNVTLFNKGRAYAYQVVSKCKGGYELFNQVTAYLEKENKFFPPLPMSEVLCIARSVSKWTWARKENFKSNKILEKKEKKRDKTLKLIIEALRNNKKMTQELVSQATGLSIRTVKYYWHEAKKMASKSF